jgi:hypothetical protein
MTVLAVTSVMRASPRGASHGAVHLLDVGKGRVAQVVDWKAPGVDWNVPGGGRGLRGIACEGGRVFIAGADALYSFTPEFELLAVYRSPYLSRCNGIAAFERRLYLTSSEYDSILGFDLDENSFGWGLHIAEGNVGLQGTPFDPQTTLGPTPGAELDLNSLWCDPRGMFISGSRSLGMLHFDARKIKRLVSLPRGVQNARPWRNGVLFNDTETGVARFITPDSNRVFRLPRYRAEVLTQNDPDEMSGAQRGFARGLCVIDDCVFAVGSSPATVTLHNLDTMKTTLSINLGTDPGHSIHSIAVWPHAVPE